LAKMQKTALPILLAQFVHQFGGQAPFGRAQSVGIPLGTIAVLRGHEGGLATHGQTHIFGHQLGIDLFAQLKHGGPLGVGVRFGHTRRLVDACHPHVVVELDLGFVHQAFNGGSGRGLWGAGQWNVAFARQQARGRVQADPACAGQVHLAPGVQVGEVNFGATGAVERLHIGGQLNQVARDKAGGYVHMTEQLNQEPGRVTAGATFQGQGFFWRLNARLHTDGVADVLVQPLVDLHQKVDGALALAVQAAQVFFELGCLVVLDQVGLQFLFHQVCVLEGHFFCRRL
jgi:hypothetical protein